MYYTTHKNYIIILISYFITNSKGKVNYDKKI